MEDNYDFIDDACDDNASDFNDDDTDDISDIDGFEYESEALMEGYDYTISEDGIDEDNGDEKIEDVIIDGQLSIDDWEQYRDYVRYTPKNYGAWESGIRGDGLLIPDDNPELAEKLKEEYGVDGLEYNLGQLKTASVSLMDFEIDAENAVVADRDLHRAMVIQGLTDILTRYEDEFILGEFDGDVDEHLGEEEKSEAERIYELIGGEEGLTTLYEGRVPPEIDIHHDTKLGVINVIESDIHKFFRHKGGYSEHSKKAD